MEEAKKLALQSKDEKETASQADGAPASKHGTRRTTKKLIKTNTKATVKGTIKKGDTTVVHGSAASSTMLIHSTPPGVSPTAAGPGNLSGTVQIKKDPPPAATGSPKQTMVVKNATVVKK